MKTGGRILADGLASSLDPVCNAFWRYRAFAGTAEPAVLICLQKSLVSWTKNCLLSAKITQDILLQSQNLILVFFVIIILEKGGLEIFGGGVGDETRTIGTLLDGASNGGEDTFGREEVDTAVDEVRDV